MLDAHLLGAGQQRLRLAQIDDDVAAFHAHHLAGGDIALLAGVLFEDDLALRLPQPLEHHLLRGLGGYAAGVLGGDLRIDPVFNLRERVALARLFERDLRLLILHLLHHSSAGENAGGAGIGVDLDDDVAGSQIVPLIGGSEGCLHRLEDYLLRQVLFSSELRDSDEEVVLCHTCGPLIRNDGRYSNKKVGRTHFSYIRRGHDQYTMTTTPLQDYGCTWQARMSAVCWTPLSEA